MNRHGTPDPAHFAGLRRVSQGGGESAEDLLCRRHPAPSSPCLTGTGVGYRPIADGSVADADGVNGPPA
ncbi:hypothetical protein GCM10010302_16710 [Streptomyces polychromogenes]|uniref:Uncharacterized protein n=1 Tax=Streptomyces polychromogenes TaxID=67342 RepID=A0ABP3EY00_9ACTN